MFNNLDFGLRIYFKSDDLNRSFKIRNQQFENLLIDECMNVEKAMNIHLLLNQVLRMNLPGEVVELGCFKGTTALIIRETLNSFNSKKELHVYDSFEGLPEKSSLDGQNEILTQGTLKVSKDDLIKNFERQGLLIPTIHKGWFKDTLSSELPATISFAHLDGDFYSSITESLLSVYPRLSTGAVVVIDDYCDPEVLNVHNILQGVKKACDDFFADKPEKVNVLLCGGQSQAYFIKEYLFCAWT